MDDIVLSSDCAQCAALCCVALAFDKSPQFQIDKPAGLACPNLSPQGRCSIHGDLCDTGFKGCAAYDCLGAGQRVTQEVFEGRSWQNDPSLLTPMMDAFGVMRRIHEQISLLRGAAKLPLTPLKREEARQLVESLQPETGWTQASLITLADGPALNEVRSFLLSLREFVLPWKDRSD